jgi:hypothetical protein
MAERVNPLLNDLLKGVFPYYWTVRQSEYATDVLFRDAAALRKVYPSLWGHALGHFGSRQVMRFWGRSDRGRRPPEVVSYMKERPEGVCIKHRMNENTLKMYDKEGSVLRIETTMNNPYPFRVLRETHRKGQPALAWQKMRKGVSDTPRRAEVSLGVNARYLDALAVVGEETPSHGILDPVSNAVTKGTYRYRPLRPISPDDSKLFAAVLQEQHLLHGVTNRQVRNYLFSSPPPDPVESKKRSAFVSRRFRLLRAHGLIHKVSCERVYRITPKGHKVMTTALLFRKTDFALLNPAVA